MNSFIDHTIHRAILGENISQIVDILLERNVSNVSEIEDYIEKFIREQNVRDDRIKRWFRTVARKFLINEFHYVQQLSDPPPDSPSWLQQAIDQGEDVYRVELGPEPYNTFLNFLEYFRSGAEDRELNRITRMSWNEVFDKWGRWKDQKVRKQREEKRSQEASEQEETIKTYSDGARWVKLIGPKALNYEGNRMSHSVGDGHEADVQAGREEIFSYRTKDNKPLVTVQTDPRKRAVLQIKGFGNNPPPSEVVGRIISFAEDELGYVIIGDRDHVGLSPLTIELEAVLEGPPLSDEEVTRTANRFFQPRITYMPDDNYFNGVIELSELSVDLDDLDELVFGHQSLIQFARERLWDVLADISLEENKRGNLRNIEIVDLSLYPSWTRRDIHV